MGNRLPAGLVNRKKGNEMEKFYMAIDQYGTHYDGLKHPRKELTEIIGCKHVDKMYVDTTSGKVYNVGYVIGRYWLNIYEVIPMRKENN